MVIAESLHHKSQPAVNVSGADTLGHTASQHPMLCPASVARSETQSGRKRLITLMWKNFSHLHCVYAVAKKVKGVKSPI